MASSGFQQVIVCGRLSKDVEIKYTPNGDAVAKITIPTSESWTDKQTGEAREKTQWHTIIAWRKPAEIIAQYCHKGDWLQVIGKLETRKWTNRDGQDQYTTEIKMESFTFVGNKSSGSGQTAGDARHGQQQSQPARQPAPAMVDDGFDDSELPF